MWTGEGGAEVDACLKGPGAYEVDTGILGQGF